MKQETDIRNKKVLIKTWKQIKKCSTKITISGHRQNTRTPTCFFAKGMKPFCGTIVQLDEHRKFKGKRPAFIRWTCEPWMVQEIIPECEDKTEYPIFKKSKFTGAIVKFTGPSEGTVVWGGKYDLEIGDASTSFSEHTDKSRWEDVAYDRKRDLWDGQPVYCSRRTISCLRAISFYDAINNQVFDFSGKRDEHFCSINRYDMYIPVPPEHYDEWVMDAYKRLNKEK